jgi:sporulation protein YlmC with PRC-barrel domain
MKYRRATWLGALALLLPALTMAQPPGEPRDSAELDRAAEPSEFDRQRELDLQREFERRRQLDMQHELDRQTQPGDAERSDAVTRLEPNQIRLRELTGSKVATYDEEGVATVDDLILEESGRVTAIVVRSGGIMGFGGRKVALPWHMVTIMADAGSPGDYRVQVAMGTDELLALPEFDGEAGTFGQLR